MSSRSRSLSLAVVLLAVIAGAAAVTMHVPAAHAREASALRVCADPNNLPFSNTRGEGLENRLAQLVAADLGEHVEYVWWAQRRGFLRNTLNAGKCDVVVGVPVALDMVLRTTPYYRSTYVFVTRTNFGAPLSTFDDPRLRTARIGVQMIGDDGTNTPPAMALSRRGITDNVRGYMVYGDATAGVPLAPIMDAVTRGDIDVAVVWGPLAGYYAKHSATPLRITPVTPQIELPFLPFVFDISMGVRRGDSTLRARLNEVIERRAPDIERLLDDYGIPRVTATRRAS